MAKYYVSGYTTPDDVKSREDVKRYQRMLGVTVDGIWGKNTQRAYEGYLKNSGSSEKSGTFDDFDWDAASDAVTEQLTKALRPSADSAIKNRRESLKTAREEIDVDAASRGMESSSFVSSMKEREIQGAESDIADIEANYQSTLASNLYSALMSLYDTYSENRIARENLALERERLEQEKAKAAQDRELAYAQLEYQKSLAKGKGSDESDDTATDAMPKMGYDYSAYYEYLNMLPEASKKKVFESDEVYWTWIRQQILSDLGKEGYYMLYNEYCRSVAGNRNKSSRNTNQVQQYEQ